MGTFDTIQDVTAPESKNAQGHHPELFVPHGALDIRLSIDALIVSHADVERKFRFYIHVNGCANRRGTLIRFEY